MEAAGAKDAGDWSEGIAAEVCLSVCLALEWRRGAPRLHPSMVP
jgi:hypothetical protein